MELDKFVASVLTEIISGIRDAQTVAGVGPFIVPGGIGGHDYAAHPRVSIKARLSSTIVDFDVAVTAEESGATTGVGGVNVLGIGANLEGTSTSKDVIVSRIQFGVPIMLPENQADWYKELTGGKPEAGSPT
jgi:hypothetical protein